MKNLKFGAIFLGLVLVVGVLVAGVSAQSDGRPPIRERRPPVDILSLRADGAHLGVMVSDLDAKATQSGVKIDEVTRDSPAEKAGIKAGDVVVEFDGEKVRSARQFTRLVQETPEGRSVSIALLRDGKRQTVNATPQTGSRFPDAGNREFQFRAMPDFNFDFDDRMPRRFEYRLPDGFRVPAPGNRFPGERGRLGVSVQSLTRDLEEYFGAKNGGALVSSVTPDSAASKAGLKAGDVITSVNGHSVRDTDDLMREIGDANGEVTIVVLRDKKEMTLKATLEPGRPSGQRAIRPSRPGIL